MASTDPAQALADLTEISSQIQSAVVFDDEGVVVGSTFGTEEEAERVASAARRLLQKADDVRRDPSVRLTQLEAATPDGSVFAVRDGGRTIAAVTTPEPTVGLVFYDLKSCLRALGAEANEKPKPQRRRRAKAAEGDAAA